MILSHSNMNSKIIYVVTSSASVVTPQKVCSSLNIKEVSSSAAVIPNSCVARLGCSPCESQVSSSTYDQCAIVNPTAFHDVPVDNSSTDVREIKLEHNYVPELSRTRTTLRMHSNDAMISTDVSLERKEHSQPDIVLENIDHSTPEIFAIEDCGSEFYLSDGVKLTDGKEQRVHNFKNDESSASAVVELNIIPDDGLWTCLYCGLSIQSSQDQIRSHLDWYCNAKRSHHGSHHEVSRPASPDIDVKTAVDPSQISTISFVANYNSYGNSCDIHESSVAGLSESFNGFNSFCRCPVCNEEVDFLRDHLSQHEKAELVNVIMKTVLPHQRGADRENDDSVIKESRDGALCAPSSLESEILLSSDQSPTGDPSHDLSSNSHGKHQNFSSDFDIKSKSRTFSTKIKSLSKKSQAQKASNSGRAVSSKSVQSNVLSRHLTSSKKSYRQWSSRAPHPCPVCGKVLSSRGNLSKHLLQHSSAKPWNCSTCALGFNSHRDWDYHQLQYHSLDRPHVCPVCSKSFAVLANLKEHVVFHGQKTKACDICGKMFWTSKCVSRHKKRHYTDKKYSCSLCSKEFAIKWDYSLHYKKVHGSK